MHILLVDDERDLTDSLQRALIREGYQVDVAYEGNTGAQLALNTAYNLLILDWMLPYQSGLEICRQVRIQGGTTPMLFLTAKDTIDDRVAGLDAGADDYLVKPFELRELLARVRALLRRPLNHGETPIPTPQVPWQVAGLSIDPDNQLAYRHGRTIDLSEKECQLLTYLMQHPGQLLTHSQIQQHLWQTEDQPASNALAAQIKLLRRKIEAPSEVPLIHTVYGRGYRFGDNAPS